MPAYGYSSSDLKQWTHTGIDPHVVIPDGTRVRILQTAFTTRRRTKIESSRVSDTGYVVYRMVDGGLFHRTEFEVE